MFSNLFEEKERQPENVEIGPNEISLDLLRAVYRSNHLPLSTRMRAAISALPHEVPRLAVTAVVSEQDFATVLDRRLKRMKEMKLFERRVVNGSPGVSDRTIEPEPKPSPPMPAPLNRLYSSRFRRI